MGNACSLCVTRGKEGGDDGVLPVVPSPRRAERQESWDYRRLLPRTSGQAPSESYHINNGYIGEGSYGRVMEVRSKRTNLACAMKRVSKRGARNLNVVANEVDINLSLDHPNICKLFDVYEDKHYIHMVFEMCTGGELFERVCEAGKLTEQQAVHIHAELSWAVNYLHAKHIAHRDLKLENMMIKEPVADLGRASILVIDFGSAKRFVPGETGHLKTALGSANYVAPEVLNSSDGYTEKCDIWSCGVIMYMLLSLMPPFHGATDAEILKKVQTEVLKFPSQAWKDVSKQAKEFVRALLRRRVDKRPAADAMLSSLRELQEIHSPRESEDLMCSAFSTESTEPEALPDEFHRRFQCFSKQSRLVRVALYLIARQVQDGENVHALRRTCREMDKNGDGAIRLQEVKAHLFPDTDNIDESFGQLDTDKSLQLDYTEFMAAAMDKEVVDDEQLRWEAFRVLDADGDGRIGVADLLSSLASIEAFSHSEAEELIREADADRDGTVNFADFVSTMPKAETPFGMESGMGKPLFRRCGKTDTAGSKTPASDNSSTISSMTLTDSPADKLEFGYVASERSDAPWSARSDLVGRAASAR